MNSQCKYKRDNRYLSFHERLSRFNQNKINRIIKSASDELITNETLTMESVFGIVIGVWIGQLEFFKRNAIKDVF